MKWNLGIVVAVALLPILLQAQEEESREFRFSAFYSQRNTYMYPSFENKKVGLIGVFTGQNDGDSVKSSPTVPVGFEIDGRWKAQTSGTVFSSVRLSPMQMRHINRVDGQSGYDLSASVTGGWVFGLSSSLKYGSEMGLRASRWLLKDGDVSSSGTFGLIWLNRLNWRGLEFLAEAGLMGFEFFGSDRLGTLRDSTTFRSRVTKNVESWNTFFWIEIFHTHKSYFASTLPGGSQGYFIDDAQASLGVGSFF
jgi:hypothetical protein